MVLVMPNKDDTMYIPTCSKTAGNSLCRKKALHFTYPVKLEPHGLREQDRANEFALGSAETGPDDDSEYGCFTWRQQEL
jgi:hypothetical protein